MFYFIFVLVHLHVSIIIVLFFVVLSVFGERIWYFVLFLEHDKILISLVIFSFITIFLRHSFAPTHLTFFFSVAQTSDILLWQQIWKRPNMHFFALISLSLRSIMFNAVSIIIMVHVVWQWFNDFRVEVIIFAFLILDRLFLCFLNSVVLFFVCVLSTINTWLFIHISSTYFFAPRFCFSLC